MVFEYQLLYLAWKEASQGKKDAPNQIRYLYELEDRLFSLQVRLERKLFKPSPLREKKIYIPKYRVAQVPSLEDKIVQHMICDFYAYDALTKPLIKEASACLIGRGDTYARNLLKESLRRFWRKYKCKPYILKCDIRNYFASIPHERLKKLIDRYVLDGDVKHIMLQYIDMTDVGLPLGLQQSQILANLYLSEMDHRLKEQFNVEFYGRHMDDFYILSHSKEDLIKLLKWISSYAASIGLEMNPKTGIFYNRIDFLGFRFFLSDTGKVIMRLLKEKKKTQKNRVRLLTRQLKEGKITPDQAAESYQGWRQHAFNGNCRNMVLSMDERFREHLKPEYDLIIMKRRVMILCREQSPT